MKTSSKLLLSAVVLTAATTTAVEGWRLTIDRAAQQALDRRTTGDVELPKVLLIGTGGGS